MKIPKNSFAFGLFMAFSVGLGLVLFDNLSPIVGIVALISFIWFKYSVESKQRDLISIRNYLLESGISSEEVAQRTNVSFSKIEFLRGNCEISETDINDLIQGLNIEKNKKTGIKISSLLLAVAIILVCIFLVYFLFGEAK